MRSPYRPRRAHTPAQRIALVGLGLLALLAAGPAAALPDQIVQEGLLVDGEGRPLSLIHI